MIKDACLKLFSVSILSFIHSTAKLAILLFKLVSSVVIFDESIFSLVITESSPSNNLIYFSNTLKVANASS